MPSMSLDTACALEIAAVVAVALVIIAVVAASSGACGGSARAARRAAVHDVELALGAATLMTYAQAAAMKKNGKASVPSPEGKEEDCCAICLSEYAEGDVLVRVVPACGHFFHAGCDVDRWLRERRRCPMCRGGLLPLPRPECPPMPPRARVASTE